MIIKNPTWMVILIASALLPLAARSQGFLITPIDGCSLVRDTIYMRANIASGSGADLAVGTFSYSDSFQHSANFRIDSIRGFGFACTGTVSWPMRHGVDYGYLNISFNPQRSETVVARLIGTEGTYIDTLILIGAVDTMPLPIPAWDVFWLSKKDFGTLQAGDSSCGLLRLVNPAEDTQIVTVELHPKFGEGFTFDTDALSFALPPKDSNTWLTFCYSALKKRRLVIDTLILKFQRVRQGEAFDTAFYYSATLTGRCSEEGFSVSPPSISKKTHVGDRDSAKIYLTKLVNDTLSIFLSVPIFTSFHFLNGMGTLVRFLESTQVSDSVTLLYEPTSYPAMYIDSVTLTDGIVGSSVSIRGTALDRRAGVAEPACCDSSLSAMSVSENPLHEATVLRFELTDAEYVRVDVFDVLGNAARTIAHDGAAPRDPSALYPAGEHSLSISLAGLPSGTYYLRITLAQAPMLGEVRTIKLVKE